eukprot:1823862-Amphidinium_carterae.1
MTKAHNDMRHGHPACRGGYCTFVAHSICLSGPSEMYVVNDPTQDNMELSADFASSVPNVMTACKLVTSASTSLRLH